MPKIHEGDLTRVIRSWPRLPPETRGSILQLIEQSATAKAVAMQANAITNELLLAAALAVEPAFRLPSGPLVTFDRLRRHPTLKAMGKAGFDAAVLHLARTSGTVCLHRHDHPLRLRAKDRALLVDDGEGCWYIGMATK